MGIKDKFIYCSDEILKVKLDKELEFITEMILDNKHVWIYENNNICKFNNDDIDKLKFTNKLYF